MKRRYLPHLVTEVRSEEGELVGYEVFESGHPTQSDLATVAFATSGGPRSAEHIPEPDLEERYHASYEAVYAYIGKLAGGVPLDVVHRNAMIWRAVQAALDATPEPTA